MAIVRTLIINNQAVLLLGAYNSDAVHRSELPGGKIEKGETIIYAAVRENKEETGLETKIVKMMGWMTNGKRERIYFAIGQMLHPRQHIILEDKFDSYLWLPISHEFILPLAPSAERALDKYKSEYRHKFSYL